MIVDDNRNLALTMSGILKHVGYDTISADCGEEAINLATANPDIDIVFMDIKMPVMNGVEAYKKLKSIIPDATVIMMTAYAVEDLIEEAMSEGAYGIIYKPLEIESALNMIAGLDKKREGGLVMVVDDDPGTLTSFTNILIRKGYQVATASDGEGAISLAGQDNFDIIFLDMKLPTINGLETYLEIKKQKPNSIVVIMTGHHQDMAELVDETLLSSAYTCLQKPLDMAQVLDLIQELMNRKKEVS
jgi:DNA-binding NtrC family response regulator